MILLLKIDQLRLRFAAFKRQDNTICPGTVLLPGEV